MVQRRLEANDFVMRILPIHSIVLNSYQISHNVHVHVCRSRPSRRNACKKIIKHRLTLSSGLGGFCCSPHLCQCGA